MVAFLKVWKPAVIMPTGGGPPSVRPEDPMPLPPGGPGAVVADFTATRHSMGTVLRGWSPFIIASVLIFATGLPAAARYLNIPALSMPMPLLHQAVLKMPPVAPEPTAESAIVNLNFLAIPGTVVFIAALIAASLARLPLSRTLQLFRRTLVQTLPSTLAIGFMVARARAPASPSRCRGPTTCC
jgi:lactate permease